MIIMIIDEIARLIKKEGIDPHECVATAEDICDVYMQIQKESFQITSSARCRLRHQIMMSLKKLGIRDMSLIRAIEDLFW